MPVTAEMKAKQTDKYEEVARLQTQKICTQTPVPHITELSDEERKKLFDICAKEIHEFYHDKKLKQKIA